MIFGLSGQYPIALLCRAAGVARSSFYYWLRTVINPSRRAKELASAMRLFAAYHEKYPSHGYRWLNAKIRLDSGRVMSAPYAHKCCALLGIKSKAKRCAYKRPGNPFRLYPNLLLAGLPITGPLQCVASDMTIFKHKGTCYELTLYMDLWNNEIVSHGLSAKKGDRNTYIDGLKGLIERKESVCKEWKTVLHSDQGSVYASEAYNEMLDIARITHSMSRAGTPTDNGAMEAINGWLKEELFTDFHITGEHSIEQEIEDYIKFFNEERPAYSLGYKTPKQYREEYMKKVNKKKTTSVQRVKK